jgi:hypothetical protein
VGVRAFDVRHDDPAAQGRAAAVRSAAELDAATRRRAARSSPAERLREGFALSRFAARLQGRARR